MASDRLFTRLGYYVFGGTPVVVDPRTTRNNNTDLTNVHEQTHRDLTNNTLYGYLLSRLIDLDGQPNVESRRIREIHSRMISGFRNVAEGSATAKELIVVRGWRSKAALRKFFSGLPQDYLEGLRIFQPLIGRIYARDDPRISVVDGCLVQAVAEFSTDFASAAEEREAEDFWNLAENFLNSDPPDAAVVSVVEAASSISARAYDRIVGDCGMVLENEGDLPVFLRDMVQGIKIAISGRMGVARPPATDADRGVIINAVEGKLRAEFPALPRLTWAENRVFGGEVQIELKEPAFLLEHELVDAERLPPRMREIANRPGFKIFVNSFGVAEPGGTTRPVVVLALTDIAGVLDTAEPVLECLSASVRDFYQIGESGLPMIWLTRGFIHRRRPLVDEEFLRQLRLPVFVYLQQFSWEFAGDLSERLDTPSSTGIYRIDAKPINALSVAAVHTPHTTVFGIVPLNFPPDFSLRWPHKSGRLIELPDLTAAVLATLRTSEKNTVVG